MASIFKDVVSATEHMAMAIKFGREGAMDAARTLAKTAEGKLGKLESMFGGKFRLALEEGVEDSLSIVFKGKKIPGKNVVHALERGNILEFAKMFDVHLSAENTALFSKVFHESALGRVQEFTGHIATMSKHVEDLKLPRNIANVNEFNQALKSLEKSEELASKIVLKRLERLEKMLTPNRTLGKLYKITIAGTVVAGLGGLAFKVIEQYMYKACGCYKFTNGSRCKIKAWSNCSQQKNYTKALSDNKVIESDKFNYCLGGPPNLLPNAPPLGNCSEVIPCCSKVCDSRYIDFSGADANSIVYRCMQISAWEAIADLTHDVVDEVISGVENATNVISSIPKYLKCVAFIGLGVTGVYVGAKIYRGFYPYQRIKYKRLR